jgi:hypothetical protein
MTARTEAQLLSGYNQQFYTNVFDAAEGVAMPFLLQQGYKTMPGVTIHQDTMLMYNSQVYTLTNRYQNPEKGNANGYYLEANQYGTYQINIFKNVWHIDIPHVFYNYSQFSFSSLADCVGFGTRLLSAVGDTTEDGNAYLSLIKTIKSDNTTIMAVRGYVASAYEFGAAFPTLPDTDPNGWSYVSGNIIADSINAYNHRKHSGVKKYNGRVKGGYGLSRAGDVLSFSYGPGGESNGHFMVMTQQPYPVGFDTVQHFYPNVSSSEIQSFLNTYDIYATPVYDCSGKQAHFHDSRVYTSGIGHGTLWIITQKNTGIPMGLIFKTPSPTAKSIDAQMLNGQHTWAITVGRYKGALTGMGNNGTQTPSKPNLSQNYPNPFNPSTNIKFQIPKEDFVKLVIFDIAGRELQTLVNGKLNAGTHSASWNASAFPSGVYFYNLQAGGFSETKKMTLVK